MSALICAWMRIDAADRDAFLDFHTREHLPERLAIPGFLRGRRFESVETPNTLLALYEVESLAVLTSAAYVERLNNPTDWTKRSMPLIRDNRRLAVEIDLSLGDAGDVLCVAHIETPSAQLADAILSDAPRLAACAGVKAVRIGHADTTASNLPTSERQALGTHPHAHGLLFIIEADSEAAARAALAASPLATHHLDAFRPQVTCEPAP